MAELQGVSSATITTLLANLDTYKYNPSAIQRVWRNYLKEVTNGEVSIVDPTNPFVFLLEASAVNTSLAVSESLSNLRKQYVSLAQTDDDLYAHMSDKDYLDRFSNASTANFTFVFQTSEIINKLLYDSSEDCYKATIPRDSSVTVGGMTFTLQYPIDIRKFPNGTVQVSYDATIDSPIDSLSTNQISYYTRTDSNNISWFSFSVPLRQFAITSTTFALTKGTPFSQDIAYSDQFFYIRAFYQNTASNNKWVEIKTTHSDQVFDSSVPTALIKVLNGVVNVSLPVIYTTQNLVSSSLRFDVYTSKGGITTDLSGFKTDAYTVSFRAIDEIRDLNDYTTAAGKLSYTAFSLDVTQGGSDSLSFEQVRERIINNTTGEQQLPITNVALDAHLTSNGFDLVKNVDVVTNRIFLAMRKLPAPANTKLLTAANIGIGTLTAATAVLQAHPSVITNGDRMTLLSNTLFLIENGVVRLVTSAELATLRTMSDLLLVSDVNSKQYVYNPFYYVLDNSESEFEVRIYDLDRPTLSKMNFMEQNQSLNLIVNTDQYTIEKIATGYRLTFSTRSGNFYKQVADGEVACQIGFVPTGESSLAYINATQTGLTTANERIFEVLIETNHDLNTSDNICVTNAKMFSNENVDVWMSLETVIDIFHTTTSRTTSYTPIDSDSSIGKFLLPNGSMANTHEQLQLTAGSSLSNLWSRSRTVPAGQTYQTYDHDVPAVYERDVYEVDPVTNSALSIGADGKIAYKITHKQGDPVLDASGKQTYSHKKGDVVLTDGKPTIIEDLRLDKEFDLMFIDGRYYFATDSAFASYRGEIAKVLSSWITEELSDTQDILLDNSRIYFYPRTTLGQVLVYTPNNGQDHITSEQALVLDLYVPESIYKDSDIRTRLRSTAITTLDTAIGEASVNISEIEQTLRATYGDSVTSLSLSNLGGSKNYRVLTLADEHNRLCIQKTLQQQQDGTMIISENVTVNFYQVR